ncbi:hypothetical protein BJ508DRAFT_313555 [Ascobolus immersus RN42]|uniref:Uncharacterized protein n=1 Tax=Ascobolus immersus RN42 TaxID=1160509 RepID=A0A3N4HIB2_ASCIM|nr:hypothetical protein BJ508DRAFT_313555 [Ascobolus immersus RN42]
MSLTANTNGYVIPPSPSVKPRPPAINPAAIHVSTTISSRNASVELEFQRMEGKRQFLRRRFALYDQRRSSTLIYFFNFISSRGFKLFHVVEPTPVPSFICMSTLPRTPDSHVILKQDLVYYEKMLGFMRMRMRRVEEAITKLEENIVPMPLFAQSYLEISFGRQRLKYPWQPTEEMDVIALAVDMVELYPKKIVVGAKIMLNRSGMF